MATRIAELKARTAPGIIEANELREIVRDFNKGASTRDEHTAKDRETIAAIERAAEAFVVACDLARFKDEAKRIAKSVTQYLKWVDGVQDVHLGDDVLKVPAIRTPAIRQLIANSGDVIIAALAEFVDAREEFAREMTEHGKAEEAALEAALEVPILAEALRLHRSLNLEYGRVAGEPRIDRKIPLDSARRTILGVIDSLCSNLYRDSLPQGADARSLTATFGRRSSEAA